MTTPHSTSIERPASVANGMVILAPGLLPLIGGPVGLAREPDSMLRLVAGISAAGVGRLRIVPGSDGEPQPAVNVGTLYG